MQIVLIAYRLLTLFGGNNMVKAIKMEVKPEEIIEAVKRMNKKERDAFLEDLIASTSPDYLESIKEARADYKKGRIKTHDEVLSH